MANREAMVSVPSARKKHRADLPGVQRVDRLDHPWPTAPLVSHLDDAPMLARGSHDQFALMWIMTARFFDIDVFACCTGQDSCRSVPVVRYGDRNGIDVFVLQKFPEIFYALRFALLLLRNQRDAAFHGPAIHVADVANLDVGISE